MRRIREYQENMNAVAIIPARGGSKRIPKKNIRQFCGKPIIAYSISVALNSGLFDEVIVSTDDEEISKIAKFYGATIYDLRPAILADDKTGVMDVVSFELRQLAIRGFSPSCVCMIYATAPMLRVIDLIDSYNFFKSSDTCFVFSAAEFAYPIFRAFKILDNGGAEMFQPEFYRTNSQDLPKAYHDAAQFCWAKPNAMHEPNPLIFSENARPFVISTNLVADIDTRDDWARAEWLYRANQLMDREESS